PHGPPPTFFGPASASAAWGSAASDSARSRCSCKPIDGRATLATASPRLATAATAIRAASMSPARLGAVEVSTFMLPVLLAADIIGSVAGWLEEILGQNGRYLDRFALRGSALPRLERGIRQPWVDRVV